MRHIIYEFSVREVHSNMWNVMVADWYSDRWWQWWWTWSVVSCYGI